MSAPFFLLGLATLAALSVVPDWPHRHLDDPSYWGLLGYLAVFLSLCVRRPRTFATDTSDRRLIRLFLLGLPLVFVADWLRFGGSTAELGIELLGLAIWVGLAFRSGRSDLALWMGCAAHAVWDGLHYGRVDFVPGWYVTACLAADIGLAAFVLLVLRGEGPPAAPGTSPDDVPSRTDTHRSGAESRPQFEERP